MNSTLAKLISLKDRVASVQELHSVLTHYCVDTDKKSCYKSIGYINKSIL